MSDSHAPKHDYHLVDPSPWPVVCSLGAFLTAVGAVLFMHEMPLISSMEGSDSFLFIVGLVILLFGAYSWWGDVIKEGEHQGFHTSIVQLGLRYGVFLFIISEVMFFVAWFWAYFNASIFPTEAIGAVWPPQDIQTLDPWHLPLINTLILLTSGTTVTWAHHALQEGDRKTFINMLLFTILLGASFTGVQVYEYAHATFAFDQNIYSSTFYMATGFHGAHVLIGTIFLTVCLFRGLKGHFKPNHHFGFEAAAWYWHFVDVVWLVLFIAIYVGGAGTPAVH
ncbi:cytochrome c oxidase subunit 3 [Paremcibacter congregatus]|uniref:cytochrome c oxidase subunit 3 n=1 Tax=Paremcibacter congregatus TaxID=2043170 RepID=UPI0030EB79A6